MIKKIYGFTRRLLPLSLKGNVTRLLYKMNIKPSVQPQSFTLNKGIITFSADFEMAWAFRYSKNQRQNAVKLGLQERENVAAFIELFEKYNIPITWATVGHLFLEKCDCENNHVHNDVLRPKYFENRNWKFDEGDWYDNDPCTNYKKDPAWYAPDLIDSIANSSINHEIGCHTFSHIDFSDKNCSKELAESEIKKCVNLASKKDITLTSMVFPGGTYGNIETLKQYGFTAYRQPMKYDICLPEYNQDGLLAIPSSTGLDKDPYGWSSSTHIKMIRKYIQKTIKSKQICHFWFHPSMDAWYLKEVFPVILEEISIERDKGNIEIKTMNQIAKFFIADE